MKLFKKSLLTLIMILSISPTLPVFAQPAIETETSIQRSDVLEYYYKMIDGVLHRRLYNATQGYWIGDWEPV